MMLKKLDIHKKDIEIHIYPVIRLKKYFVSQVTCETTINEPMYVLLEVKDWEKNFIKDRKKKEKHRPLQVLEIGQFFSHPQLHVRGLNSRVKLKVPSPVCLFGSRK